MVRTFLNMELGSFFLFARNSENNDRWIVKGSTWDP
jgi:hypothetical protein